ncbi:MAG: hypothetical protein V1723_00495 [Candidatus Uhrbacteria bacterium]
MADERKLFDKPMPELREAFVRARFAQGDVFAHENIEKWLAQQRKAKRPDDQKWKRYCEDRFVLTHATSAPLETLRTCATEHRNLPPESECEQLFPGEIRRHCERFLRPLHLSALHRIYYGYDEGGIVVLDNERAALEDVNSFHGRLNALEITYPGPHVDQRLRLELTIVDVLYAEWRYGRPKFRQARTRLCDALAEEIKRERAKAEHDFDSAVAVSADGTKVVCADWMVVHCGMVVSRGMMPRDPVLHDEKARDRYLVFHGEWFRSHKAHRPNNISRQDADVRGVLEENAAKTIIPSAVAAIVRKNLYGRAPYVRGTDDALLFFCNVHDVTIRIYCTTADLCPSPLPDGGVEVTV